MPQSCQIVQIVEYSLEEGQPKF